MTPELTVLALAALLQVVQIILYAVVSSQQVGHDTAVGPRDDPVVLTGYAGRISRAMNNHFEGLLLFSIAVCLVTFSNQSSPFTVNCAWIYLGARVLYIPAYIFGLTPWRSLIWMGGVGATAAMIIAVLV